MEKMFSRMMCAAITACLAVGALPMTAAYADPASELQKLKEQLPGKLINDPTRLDWEVFGSGGSGKPIIGGDAPGGGALQITVKERGRNLYDVGATVPLTSGFTKGKTYVISFYARALKANASDGSGLIGVRFQQKVAPYNGFGETELSITKEWQLYEVSGRASVNIPASEAIVQLQLAGRRQVIEIGQTIVQEGATSALVQTDATPAACDVVTPVLPPTLVGKGAVLTTVSNQNWDFYGAGESHKRVTACGVPGDSALEISVASKSANPYDVGTGLLLNEPVKAGDVFIVGVVARTIKADTPDGMGLIGLRVQQNISPYAGFGDQMIAFGPSWQLKRFMVRADRDLPAGQGLLALQFAGAKQTIQVGRAYVIRTKQP